MTKRTPKAGGQSAVIRNPFSGYAIYLDEFCQRCGHSATCRCRLPKNPPAPEAPREEGR